MTTEILLAARRRQLAFPGEDFELAVKSSISDGYAWFAKLAIKKVRPSKSPAVAIAAWKKIWDSPLGKAMSGHEEYGNLVAEITKYAVKFGSFEGTVPDEPLKKNSVKEMFTRATVHLERLANIIADEFENVAHVIEGALEENGSAEEGLTIEQIVGGDRSIRTFLSMAMPRMANNNSPPLAYLFVPNEDEPLVMTFANGRFAVLDTEGERWTWVSKDTGKYECLSSLFEEKQEWLKFNDASRAVLFGVGSVPRRNPFRSFNGQGGKRKRARQSSTPNTYDK